MNTESEFKLIKDLKAIDGSELEKTAYQLINSHNQLAMMNAESSLNIEAQNQVINMLAESLAQYKSKSTFWFMWSMLSSIGVVGLFLLLLAN